VLGHLVVGQSRPEQGAERSDVERHAGLQLDHHLQRLAEFVVGNAEYRAIVHAGKAVQRGFDFRRDRC
jgi:hypothetical protein